MITREDKGFFAAHYDWIAAIVGAVALVGGIGFYFMSLGENPDEAAAAEVKETLRVKPSAAGVKAVEMAALETTAKALEKPPTATEISAKAESFLASERRVFCVSNGCGRAIVGDLKVCPVCPFCGAKQEQAVKVVLDADGDGMTDEWEKRYGLDPRNPADATADKDKDGFTNLAEFQAKPQTDPTDAKDHPDYLDSLKIVLPLKETKMPFVFRKASQIPGGWRCDFLDPARRDDFGRMGRTVSVKTGEKIIDRGLSSKEMRDPALKAKGVFEYGYTLRSYTPKSEKRSLEKQGGMKVDVDISEAVVERDRDGKKITLVIQSGKGVKLAAVDVQATLQFSLGGTKTFEVTPGDTIELFGNKYRISAVQPVGKGAKVTVVNVVSGKERVLEALAQ